jgi:homoserine O-acetyltransferase
MSEYIEHDRDKISVGIVEKKLFTFAEPPDEMVLESGARFGPLTLAYETCGTLNEDKSNVILILHALSGDSHVAGYYTPDDEKPGWWDNMVGPGKGIDTDKYFIVCSNIIGSCMGSTGPCTSNPKTVLPYGLDFPVVTIGDMVEAQKALMDHLGVKKLLAVVGGSIGGMQVLEWCVRYP